MRRRELMGAGMGMLTTSFVSTTTAQQSDYDRVVAETHTVSGLATGLSQSGDTVLFGFDDGNVMVYDDERDGAVIPLAIDRSVSHIEVSDETTTAVIGWMDGDVFAPFDLETGDGTFVEQSGLWDLATTPDAGRTAFVTNPSETPGSVGVADGDGTVPWETPLGDATGRSVAISAGGNHIAVGAGRYWEHGTDPSGQPGVRLYDGTGTELWRHARGEDVLSVDITAERELVVAGTDDGRAIVLDLEGNVVWETDEIGGWLVLSDDGGTILTAEGDGTLYALDAATGGGRWTADIGMWPAADLSVSADGSRVFAADRGAAEFAVVEAGETIWADSHDVGPGLGAIAADGGTWSTIVTNLDDESALLEVYRAPDAVAEPEPAPRADDPPDEGDDSPEEKDGSGDDDGGSNDKNGDPEALELVDYHILGEQASEEYITLRNTGDEPLEMSGWTIRDRREGGRVGTNVRPFTFPPGFTLAPGAAVTIYTGEGESPGETLSWGYSGDFQIWNEEGDDVIVRDADGNIVLNQRIAAQPEENPPAEEPEEPTDPPGNESNQPGDNETEEPTDPPGNESDRPADPPGGNETEEPTEPPSEEPTELPGDNETDGSADPPSDGPDGPTDPPGGNGPDEPADQPGGAETDQPTDPPDDEPTAPPDTGPDESSTQPADNATGNRQ